MINCRRKAYGSRVFFSFLLLLNRRIGTNSRGKRTGHEFRHWSRERVFFIKKYLKFKIIGKRHKIVYLLFYIGPVRSWFSKESEYIREYKMLRSTHFCGKSPIILRNGCCLMFNSLALDGHCIVDRDLIQLLRANVVFECKTTLLVMF